MPLRIHDDATTEEAAAIAAALATHLRDEAAAAKAEGDAASWDGKRWMFAGRLEGLGTRGVRDFRLRDGTPNDPWTASGRRDRF